MTRRAVIGVALLAAIAAGCPSKGPPVWMPKAARGQELFATIRTTGGQVPYADINLKRNVDAGNVPGPRIFVTTPYLTGEGGGGSMSVARTPEEARRFVAYWAEEGASWIKFYTNISRENVLSLSITHLPG